MSKLFSKRLFIYEIKTILKNWYIPFFGVVFPILLSQLIGRTAFVSGVPENVQPYVFTEGFYNFAMVIPLCVVMLGHASMYSQDLEHGIPQRLKLFGISINKQLTMRLLAIMFINLVSFLLFTVTYALSFKMMDITVPALLLAIVSFSILSLSLFLIAHAVALLLKKFEPTYGVTMGLYFFLMIISGSMGLRQSDFPAALKFVAQLFPVYHMPGDISKLYYQSVNLAPLAQALVFFLLLSVGLLLFALQKNKKSFR